MPLIFAETSVRFEGVCCVEEALPLLEHCREAETPRVDLAECTYLPTALLQLLLLLRPQVGTLPADPFLARWLPRWLAQPTDAAMPVCPRDPP
jgi:hypothetical protein